MISFCPPPNECLIYCLQTDHKYCFSLWFTAFFVSVISLCWKSNQESSTYRCDFELYHWLKSKTVVCLKLNFVKYQMQFLHIYIIIEDSILDIYIDFIPTDFILWKSYWDKFSKHIFVVWFNIWVYLVN